MQHPGGEAQVDFGEIDIYQDGKLVTAHEFVISFPASNEGFCQVTISETMEAVCESLATIFEHVGKVPNRIWFDQMAAAALRQKDANGNVVANPRFHGLLYIMALTLSSVIHIQEMKKDQLKTKSVTLEIIFLYLNRLLIIWISIIKTF